MQPPSGDFKNLVKSLRPALQSAASRQAEKAMRTPSAIVAELEDAFVSGKSERDLLVLIRELRAAISGGEECLKKIIAMQVSTEFERQVEQFRLGVDKLASVLIARQ